MSYVFEIVIILVLIVLNGILALSEFAIISAKKTRLQQKADEGDKRAAAAFEIAHEPTHFLSTIQIGITLVGIFAGAFGGATIAEKFAIYLKEFPLLAPNSDILAITLVVLVITYLTLIFGELVPKHLALNNAENIASAVAKPMRILITLSKFSSIIILNFLMVSEFFVNNFVSNSQIPSSESFLKIPLSTRSCRHHPNHSFQRGVPEISSRSVGESFPFNRRSISNSIYLFFP